MGASAFLFGVTIAIAIGPDLYFVRQTTRSFVWATSALLFGVTIAIAIGPIALLIMNVSANTGLQAGLRSAAGAAAADLTYALLAFAIGYRLAPLVKNQQSTLGILASLVLVGFGIWMVIVALRRLKTPQAGSPDILSRPFLQTYALTAVNPLTLVLFAGFAVQSAACQFANPHILVWWFGRARQLLCSNDIGCWRRSFGALSWPRSAAGHAERHQWPGHCDFQTCWPRSVARSLRR